MPARVRRIARPVGRSVAARAGSVNTVRFADGRSQGQSTDGEGFIASDVPAILEHTKNVVILHEGDVADV